MSTLFDTSTLIAAFCSWHQAHASSLRYWMTAINSGSPVMIAAHSLAECYSVLTRLPPPHRLSTEASYRLVESNLFDKTLISLSSKQYVETLADCRADGIAGGTVYDALIVKAALVGQATSLVTLNARHFRRLAPASVSVVEP